MNLPVHIITCQTPSMNLPAHGTASPDPSKASLSVRTTHQKAKDISISAWLGPHAARRNCSRPPGGIHSPPGANVLPDPLFSRHRLAELDPSRQAPLGAGFTHATSIAWRWSTSRQAPYQRHSAADIWHSLLVNSTAQVIRRATHLLVSVPHSDLLPIPNLF